MEGVALPQPSTSHRVGNMKKKSKASTSSPKQRLLRHQMKSFQHHLGLRNAREGIARYRWEAPPILVSIDVEAFEYNHSCITEVGMSVLDCAKINGTTPGPNGHDWFAMIEAQHFRIEENKQYVNRKHVPGHPEKFQFGQTQFIRQRDLSQHLREYFQSLPYKPCTPDMELPVRRIVVLVGHAVENDIKYMRTLGFDVSTVISSKIDTLELSRVALRSNNGQSLGKLLDLYKLQSAYLHNAGNDACYTLQAAIAICVDHVLNHKARDHWESVKEARIQKAIQDAIAKVAAEFEGWSSSDEEDEDMPTSAEASNNILPAAQASLRSEKQPEKQRSDPIRSAPLAPRPAAHVPQSIKQSQRNFHTSTYAQQLQEIYTGTISGDARARAMPLTDYSNSTGQLDYGSRESGPDVESRKRNRNKGSRSYDSSQPSQGYDGACEWERGGWACNW